MESGLGLERQCCVEVCSLVDMLTELEMVKTTILSTRSLGNKTYQVFYSAFS